MKFDWLFSPKAFGWFVTLEIIALVIFLVGSIIYGYTSGGQERARIAAERREFHAYVKSQAEEHFSENSEYDCIKRIIELRQKEKEEEEREEKEERERRKRRHVVYVPV